jgi:hypothetical protein
LTTQSPYATQPDDADDRPQKKGRNGEQQMDPEVGGRVTGVVEGEPAAVLPQVLDESDSQVANHHHESAGQPP